MASFERIPRPSLLGPFVMATGIVSVGLGLVGWEGGSRAVLAVAGVWWAVLVVDFLLRPSRESWAAAAPVVVAGTCVVGSRIVPLGWLGAAQALLAGAVLLWPAAVYDVVRRWRGRRSGAVFLGCVATQGVAVLGATLGARMGVAWLSHTALVLFWLGLVLYCVGLLRFAPREIVEGAGEQWIAGGALAISALAGARLLTAGDSGPYLWSADDHDALRAVTVVLLTLALVWYAVLVVAEVRWPRPRYDVHRWATVFPLGMTAVATLSVAAAAELPGLKGPGRVLVWVAAAVWAVCVAGALWAVRASGAAGRSGVPVRSRAPR